MRKRRCGKRRKGDSNEEGECERDEEMRGRALGLQNKPQGPACRYHAVVDSENQSRLLDELQQKKRKIDSAQSL